MSDKSGESGTRENPVIGGDSPPPDQQPDGAGEGPDLEDADLGAWPATLDALAETLAALRQAGEIRYRAPGA